MEQQDYEGGRQENERRSEQRPEALERKSVSRDVFLLPASTKIPYTIDRDLGCKAGDEERSLGANETRSGA